MKYRIGNGYDVHALVEGKDLILGGVNINHEKGLLGHSDADVLLHSIIDACLGALALGDIGKHFPDTDAKYKDADSRILLRHILPLISAKGYKISNIDSTIVAERPKLLNYIDKMRENIATDLKIDLDQISVKATTNEKLGYLGKEQGIAAYAVALVETIED